ncbi:MAG: DUF2894 domain-containing protein [Cellvibrionaceae bacterium]|nr:DUF2894 domain-containing protein [Cellvibrionaceae bacterium]
MTELAACMARLQHLQSEGGQHHDPVRWRYIEALLERAGRLPAQFAGPTLAKAESALQAYQQHWREALAERAPNTEPEFGNEALQQLTELSQCLAQQAWAPEPSQDEADWSSLLQQQERALVASAGLGSAQAQAPELRSMAPFRQSWERIRAERIAIEVAKEAPENPGPLNQHMQIIRLLSSLHQLSPAYFSRYVSYLGSLMWLEKASVKSRAKSKKSP